MIIASAIKFYYKDDTEHRFPQIWTGLHHSDIFKRMACANVEYDKETAIQGFITDNDVFLDRRDARVYAYYKTNQISKDIYTNSRELFSEDIWPEEP